MEEKRNVPKLRFPGFTDPWEQRRLGDEFEFLRNNTLSRAELSDSEGSCFDVHYGDVLIKFGSVIDLEKMALPRVASDKMASRLTCDKLRNGDVVVADTAEDEAAGKCVELRKIGDATVYPGLHTMPLRPLRRYAPGFLGHYLNSSSFRDQLKPLMQGIKVISVSRAVIAGTSLIVPAIDEQDAIAKTFAKLDSLIALHQRELDHVKELKKGLLQKMFPKEGTNVPELRFPGFTDPWEQRRLGEVAHRVTRKNEEGMSDLPLTISAQHGLVDQRDFFNSQVASRDMRGYYLLERGEFAYNKSTSSDSPWGAIKRLTEYEKGCLSTLYICFGLDEGDPDFLVTYYETSRWHRGIRMIAAEGARNHGLLNIAPGDFFETELTLPGKIEEQTAIGALFAKLDSLIALHQRELDHVKELKRGLLQQMFV